MIRAWIEWFVSLAFSARKIVSAAPNYEGTELYCPLEPADQDPDLPR